MWHQHLASSGIKTKKGSTWTLSSAKCSFASLAREGGGEDSNTTIAIATQVPVQVSKPTIYFIGKADIFSKIVMVVNRSIIVKAFRKHQIWNLQSSNILKSKSSGKSTYSISQVLKLASHDHHATARLLNIVCLQAIFRTFMTNTIALLTRIRQSF